MSLKDKLEVGLKPDAPFRPDNLPDFQQDDPACKVGATPGDSAAVNAARAECEEKPASARKPRRAAATRRAPVKKGGVRS